MQDYKIAVLGAGSWGTTLAILLFKKGYKVSLWDFSSETIESILRHKENVKFLPDISFPCEISLTSSLEEALDGAKVAIIATPSQVTRDVVRSFCPFINEEVEFLVSGVKGLEVSTGLRISEVITSCLPSVFHDRIAVISGPSHAEEVAREIPTTVIVSAQTQKKAERLQQLFLTPYFRVYTNLDMIGVELGGALKNIIAIACGISDGLGFGDNTKAALMVRGIQEISRFGVLMGANPATFSGLSGMGDLITTCISKYSRNRNLGEMIGKGKTLKQALSEMVMVAEGVPTTEAVYRLAEELKIDLPITEQVYQVLFEGKPPIEAVASLMSREPKPEILYKD